MSAKLPGCGELDGDGWLTGARRVDSPNFDARPDGEVIALIVVLNAVPDAPTKLATALTSAAMALLSLVVSSESLPSLPMLRPMSDRRW